MPSKRSIRRADTLPQSHVFLPRNYRFKEQRIGRDMGAVVTLERRIRATPFWVRSGLRLVDGKTRLAEQTSAAMASLWRAERERLSALASR